MNCHMQYDSTGRWVILHWRESVYRCYLWKGKQDLWAPTQLHGLHGNTAFWPLTVSPGTLMKSNWFLNITQRTNKEETIQYAGFSIQLSHQNATKLLEIKAVYVFQPVTHASVTGQWGDSATTWSWLNYRCDLDSSSECMGEKVCGRAGSRPTDTRCDHMENNPAFCTEAEKLVTTSSHWRLIESILKALHEVRIKVTLMGAVKVTLLSLCWLIG